MPPKCHFGTVAAKMSHARHVACPPPFFSDRAENFLGGYWVKKKVRLGVSRSVEQKAPPSGPSAKFKIWSKSENPLFSKVNCLSNRVLGVAYGPATVIADPPGLSPHPITPCPAPPTVAPAREGTVRPCWCWLSHVRTGLPTSSAHLWVMDRLRRSLSDSRG